MEKAYPSIPHRLIRFALNHYHVLQPLIDLIMRHLGDMKMRFTASGITSQWHALKKGIMAGCTISVTLFVAPMNVILEEVAKECKGPKTI